MGHSDDSAVCFSRVLHLPEERRFVVRLWRDEPGPNRFISTTLDFASVFGWGSMVCLAATCPVKSLAKFAETLGRTSVYLLASAETPCPVLAPPTQNSSDNLRDSCQLTLDSELFATPPAAAERPQL